MLTRLPEASIPVLSIGNVTLTEGNSGTKTFTFTVSISGANTLPVSVNFATADGTATAASGDYVATSGTLTWAAGDNAAKTIGVTVNGDTTVEPDETFYVNLEQSDQRHALQQYRRGNDRQRRPLDLLRGCRRGDAEERHSRIEREPGDHLADNERLQPRLADGDRGWNSDCSDQRPVQQRVLFVHDWKWAVGDHTYAIQATDSKGVSCTSTGTFTVVAPPSSDPTIGLVVVSQSKGKISWNVLDPDGVASSTLSIDGTSVPNVSGPYTASSGVNYSAPLGSLSVGDHPYTITATDKLGNRGNLHGHFQHREPGPDDRPSGGLGDERADHVGTPFRTTALQTLR